MKLRSELLLTIFLQKTRRPDRQNGISKAPFSIASATSSSERALSLARKTSRFQSVHSPRARRKSGARQGYWLRQKQNAKTASPKLNFEISSAALSSLTKKNRQQVHSLLYNSNNKNNVRPRKGRKGTRKGRSQASSQGPS
jgi:hypothetical protein